MNPPFVKKFDFRGVYGKDITEKDAFYLGLAIQKVLPLKKIVIGWDTRESSEKLALSFIESFKDTSVHVSILQKCPIDYVTTAANACDFDYAVMFTGSHNPWTWTGLLMHTSGGRSVQGDLVPRIVEQFNALQTIPFRLPSFLLTDLEDFQPIIEDIYVKKIISLLPLDQIKPMRVLVDVGDGSGSKALSLVSRYLPQVTFLRLNDRELYDGDTPHTADPSIPANMEQLSEAVKTNAYDCGFAFDSDADRVLAVDEKGIYLNGSVLASAMIDSFTSLKFPLKKIGYAVECGPALYNAIHDVNVANSTTLESVAVPVGRSILREKVSKSEVDVAVENVGHFYVKAFFQTDSGTFSMLVLLYWMTHHGPLSQLLVQYPDGQRDQFSKPLEENQEEKVIQLANETNAALGKESKNITVDGVRNEFFEAEKMVSWYAIRPSGYEKAEKFYFGSLNPQDYAILKKKFQRE